MDLAQPRLDLAHGDEARLGGVAGRPLVQLPNIDDHGTSVYEVFNRQRFDFGRHLCVRKDNMIEEAISDSD